MNLREAQLSSRSVIPVALALPLSAEPTKRETREHENRAAGTEQCRCNKGPVCFYL